MSTDRDVTTRIVRSWLHEDGYEDADRILNLVLDEIDTIPQRSASWLARRFPTMNNYARIGLVAAAVVLAAVVGIGLYARSGVGGPPIAPTPSPTASPAVTLTYLGPRQTLAEGRYSILPGRTTPVKLTFTMPAGWEEESLNIIKHRGESGEVGWTTSIVDRVYTDTCAADGTAQPIGPTVDDLVTALEQLGGATVSPAVDTTVGGYPAKRVDIVLPDVDVATCRVPILQIWVDAAEQDFNALDPLQQESVYIIDVAGQVVVIFTTSKPDSSAQDLAEMDVIIGSMQIEPAAP